MSKEKEQEVFAYVKGYVKIGTDGETCKFIRDKQGNLYGIIDLRKNVIINIDKKRPKFLKEVRT